MKIAKWGPDEHRLDACRLQRNADHGFAHGTYSIMTWDQANLDPMNMWDGGTAMYIRKTGLYVVSASIRFTGAGSTGYRAIQVRRDGNAMLTHWIAGVAGVVQSVHVSGLVYATTGQYFQMAAYQDGNSPNLGIEAGYDRNFMQAVYVGKGL